MAGALVFIDRSSLDEWRGKALNEVKPNTVNTYCRAPRTAWNLAIDCELRDSTIDERHKYFSEEEVEQVLDGFDTSELSDYFRPATELSLYCGLRLSEVRTLTSDDIKAGQLWIRGKGNKVRTVPLRGRARHIAVSRVNGSPWLFPSERDHSRHVESTRFTKQFSSHCLAVGCPRGHFHMLRHTFATRLLTSGVAMIAVSRWMGHSSVKVTDQT